MTDDVKPKRSYRSPKRAAQARDTRAAILAAAHELFTRSGWEKTTIAAIARGAGVASETIYATFGSKPAILRELVKTAVRGAEPEMPLLDQAGPRAVMGEPDRRRQIALFAKSITEVLDRVAPLMAVVRSAAGADPEIAGLEVELQNGRRGNLARFAAALAANGPLRRGMDADAATSEIWRLASPELFLLVTRTEGLPPERFAAWLAETLDTLLLPPAV